MDKNSLTLLVVEDDPIALFAIQKKSEMEGFRVLTASSVPEAKKFLERGEKIDAIWLDHYLPGSENGLTFLAFLKSEKSSWKNIPVFVVSNTTTPEDIQAYLQSGASKSYIKVKTTLAEILQDIQSNVTQTKKE